MRLYHATNAELIPGTVLLPLAMLPNANSPFIRLYEQYDCNWNEQYRSDFVWLSTDKDEVAIWGKNIWLVETVGPVYHPDSIFDPDDIVEFDSDDYESGQTRKEVWGESPQSERVAFRAICIRKESK